MINFSSTVDSVVLLNLSAIRINKASSSIECCKNKSYNSHYIISIVPCCQLYYIVDGQQKLESINSAKQHKTLNSVQKSSPQSYLLHHDGLLINLIECICCLRNSHISLFSWKFFINGHELEQLGYCAAPVQKDNFFY